MKATIGIIAIATGFLLMIFAGVTVGHSHSHTITYDSDKETGDVVIHRHGDSHHSCGIFDGVDLDVDDGDLILIPNRGHRDEEVKITEKGELYVNDQLVKTDDKQQGMVKDYYDLTMEILNGAEKIGAEGARIGVSGAALGVKALGRVAKLLEADYDEDDLEREMERDAAKIEAQAEKLEKKAEVIEEMADELEELHDNMIDEIPALDKLGWF